MSIWKKITAGFGVLLILVLLVGLVALRALGNIEQVTTGMVRELPAMTEKVLELRRFLLKGVKDYNSYFLTSKRIFWEGGERNLLAARQTTDDFTKDHLGSGYYEELRPFFLRLREDIDNYFQLANESMLLDANIKRIAQTMNQQGNAATEASLQYLEWQIKALSALPAPINMAEFQRLGQLLAQADVLNRSVADTRSTASTAFVTNGILSPTDSQLLLDKDSRLIEALLRLERQPEAKDILHRLREALQQRNAFSNENTAATEQLQKNGEQMADLETLLYDTSRVLLQKVRDLFLQQLNEQRTITADTGRTLLFFLISALVCGVIFAALLSQHVTGAIMRSLHFAQSVSKGDLSKRLPVRGGDELNQINQAMNSMLDTLNSKIEEAHQKELEAIEARHQAEKAQSAAEEASRTKDDFLARMSHEIRTPMNAIIGLGHLCQQTRLDEQQRQYMHKILGSANELLGILNEILDFSKIEGGKLELDRIPFQLNVVMDNLWRILSQRAKAKGLDFVYHLDRHIPSVLVGDPLRLTQVLINLTGNAVKFTDKGAVAVTVRCMDSSPAHVTLRFRIKDTGIGMTPEQFHHIFQPFTQADGSNTRRFGGTGLGLSVSQRLVALMEGSMEAESNPDGGSVFSFTVSFKVGAGSAPQPLRTVQDMRVLVVDDSPLALQVTAANFASLGMDVDCVESGAEALRTLAVAEQNSMPYHLIILDWRMPEMDGLETARRIRQAGTAYEPPAIILHSDYELHQIQAQALAAGVTAFLPKPATANAFYSAITEALGHTLEPQDQAEHPAPEQGAPLSSRILLVEDNEINQEIACELLKMAQVDVDTVNNGQEAVEAVACTPYALIFMDVQMPVMDGLEATRRIRAAGHVMPIIAMTAHAMRGDKDISLAAGMNDHLTKPLDPEALFATLNHWLPLPVAQVSGQPSAQSSSQTPSAHSLQGAASAPTRYLRSQLPERIEGFNLSAGLAAVGNNEKLYADLLGKFATRYATITEDITNSLQHNDLETAVRLAHTVKGIAANLGAESLAEAAGALEKTITHDPSMTTPHLKTLVLRLADAVNAVRAALDSRGAHSDNAPSAAVCSIMDTREVESLCEHLYEAVLHMETDWNKAVSVTEQARQTLSDTDMERQARELCYAVEDFETQTALALCMELQTALRHAAHSGR